MPGCRGHRKELLISLFLLASRTALRTGFIADGSGNAEEIEKHRIKLFDCMVCDMKCAVVIAKPELNVWFV
jgi:hypothetical protein